MIGQVADELRVSEFNFIRSSVVPICGIANDHDRWSSCVTCKVALIHFKYDFVIRRECGIWNYREQSVSVIGEVRRF